MEEEFIPHELAVKLKVLGFDRPCYAYIYTGDTGNNYDHYIEVKPSDAKDWNEDDLCVSLPTFPLAFRWFREKYDLFISITHYENGYSINDLRRFDTYEEAETACLQKLIEIVEQNKLK
jgi:hypothetical protein